jgi:hypothetical protein
LAFGVITLVWPSYDGWLQPHFVPNAQIWQILVYADAVAQIFGGIAIRFRRTAKMGAIAIGVVYLDFALLCIPRIAATPQVYNPWGNFFEQFSIFTGAVLVYARWSSVCPPEIVKRIGRIFLGLCAASFALEQAFYLSPTATLVPKWVPPSQMFWAVTTTVLFALAALALITDRLALFATRLLTLMLVSFGLFVWVPLLFSDPHNHANWGETAETFAIAGSAWILADLLGEYRPDDAHPFRI